LRTLIKFLLIGLMLQGFLCSYQYLNQNVKNIFGNVFGQEELDPGKDTAQAYESTFQVTEAGGAGRRARGTVGPPNAQALYFEFLLPLAFLLWLSGTRFLGRHFVFLALCLGSVGILLTFSRGGFIGVIAGISLALLLARRFKIISQKKFLAIALAGSLAGLVLFSLVFQLIMTRPESTSARFHLAEVGWEMVKEFPILGVGVNNHMLRKSEFDSWTYALALPTHNHYILTASQVGIPGLVFFLGFLGVTFRLALQAARGTEPYLGVVALGIIGALTAIGVHVMADYLSTHVNITLLWLFAGLAAALHRLGPETSQGEVCLP
jgi:putative inorganic carbon (HCO3(-)) transporter